MKPSVYVKLSVNLNALNELPRDAVGNVTLIGEDIANWASSDGNPFRITESKYVPANEYYEIPTDWMQIASMRVENVEVIALISSEVVLPTLDIAALEQLSGRALAAAHGVQDDGINLDGYSIEARYSGNMPVSDKIAAEYAPTIRSINDTLMLAKAVGVKILNEFKHIPNDILSKEGHSDEPTITMRWIHGFFFSVSSVGDQIVPTFDSSAPRFAQWSNYCGDQVRLLSEEDARRIA